MFEGQPLNQRLVQQPSSDPAVQSSSGTWSFGQLIALIEKIAFALKSLALADNDRVIIAYPDGIEFLAAILATQHAGAIPVPAMYPVSEDKMSWLKQEIQPALVLTPDGDTQLECPVDLRAKILPKAENPKPAANLSLVGDVQNPAVIRFTSGSTGRPKGIVLDHRQQSWSAYTLSTTYKIDRKHRELVFAPIAFSGAWQRLAATLWGGGCVVFYEGFLSLPGLLEAIAEDQITGFFMTPPMLRSMLAASPERVRDALANCLTIEVGSAPLADVELQQFARLVRQARVFFHYGLTECSRATVLDLQAYPHKAHTVGQPLSETKIEIRNDKGQKLGAGIQGEIFLSGPQRCRAYWRRGQSSPAAEQWLSTGDHGYLDEDGFLIYAGREDDLIVSGGFSFYPAEVERELGEIKMAQHYLIAGVEDPDGLLGQVPWAFVVANADDKQAQKKFLQAARARLATYKVPRRVILLPELPVTESGKPDRKRAVEDYLKLKC